MPELPDVEVFKQYVQSTAFNNQISKVEIFDHRVLAETSESELSTVLEGERFVEAKRHGKYLLIRLYGGDWLAFHFGMTGFFKYFKDLSQDTDHDSIRFDFTNGMHLAYDCTRKLGQVQLVQDPQAFLQGKDLGQDPLDPELTQDRFLDLFSSRRGKVKSQLMHQSVLAGLGNIYSDEILFQAGIHPGRQVQGLSREELVRIFQAMHQVIKAAVDNQADPDRLPERFLIPRRHPGGRCPVCGSELQKVTVSGRHGFACPLCQPESPEDRE